MSRPWPRTLKRLGHLVDVSFARTPPVVLPEERLPWPLGHPGIDDLLPDARPGGASLSRCGWRARVGLIRAASTRRVFHLWFHPTNLAYERTKRMFTGLRESRACFGTSGGRSCDI